jgi:protein TonB
MKISLTKRFARIFESHQATAWVTSLAVHVVGATALCWTVADRGLSPGEVNERLRPRIVLQAVVRGVTGEPARAAMPVRLVASVPSLVLDEPAPRERLTPARARDLKRLPLDRVAAVRRAAQLPLPAELHAPVSRPAATPDIASLVAPARQRRPLAVVTAGLIRAEPRPAGGPTPSTDGSDRTPPRLVRNRAPAYPEPAIRNGWQGTVLLRVHIDAAGYVMGTELVSTSGHAILDAAAIRAVRQWRYEPARVAGGSVGASVRQPVVFTLQGQAAGP